MVQPYRQITPELVSRLKLVMTDVDGTLVLSGDALSQNVVASIRRLETLGIKVGLISGRTMPKLESMAASLGISGPIIAENGGVAKLATGGRLLDLGYCREPALKTLEELKKLYPQSIRGREDNLERLIDVVFWADGINLEEIKPHLGQNQLLDSGYILHLMQKGISKGLTLRRILAASGDGFSAATVMIFGDSLTDISLFEMFPHSVLVTNPKLAEEHKKTLSKIASYSSSLDCGEGFAEVAFLIAEMRQQSF
jgi:phosphoglycolate phosphatase